MNEGEPVVVSKPHRALRAVNIATILGGIGLLALSIWPGFVIGCFLVLAYPLIFILGLLWLFIVIRAAPKPWGRGVAIPLTQIIIAPIIVCTTYGMLRLYIPRHIAFRAHLSQFEKHLPAATATTQPILLNRWLGIYRVSEILHDPTGGIYFRTGGDRVDSYGFVYRPNREARPFGYGAVYTYRRITGDWYWFHADDGF